MRSRALTHDATRQAVARPAEEDLLFLDDFLGRHLFLLGRRVGADRCEGDAEFSRTRRVERKRRKRADSACCWAVKGGYQRREGKGKGGGGGRFVCSEGPER
jgi:hypothetical protein